MTWNEAGKLVPLSESEQARLLDDAAKRALANPCLPENPVLSVRETLNLVFLDIAHMIDRIFRPPDHVSITVAVQPPILALILFVFLLRAAWVAIIPLVFLIVGFRIWVWLAIENPKTR